MRKLNVVGVSGQAGAGKDVVAAYLVDKYGFSQLSLADPIKRFGNLVFGFSEEQLWGPSAMRNKLDKRYKKYGQSTGIDDSWMLASTRLMTHGRQWIAEVLDVPVGDARVQKHYAALIHWFHWLGQQYPQLSPRIMLQTLGTEWGRERVDADIWINYVVGLAKILLREDADGAEGNFSYDRTKGLVLQNLPSDCRGIVVSDVRFLNELRAIKAAGGFLVKVSRPETDLLASTVGLGNHASETEQGLFTADQFNFILNNDGSIADLHSAIDVMAGLLT